ncbi:MAG: glycosyltransferase family 9 protein [Gemmatimonadota bacterium]|nr:glycosyltransferase family 9 protein [Gemmatimonadota bacterium]
MKPLRVLRPRRILVTQLRRLGDVVLTTALLPDLRRAFPEAAVDFLVGDRAAPLLEHHPLITERLIYDRARATRSWRLVRARRYDWVIDPQSSPRTAPLALVSGAPVRAGFGVRGWGWVYTHRLPRAVRPTEYVARERQRLLEMLGVQIAPARTSLSLTSEERARGRALLESHGIQLSSPVVALVLSAGEAKKEWPPEHFGALIQALAADGVRAVAFEMPGDATKIARATAAWPWLVNIATPALRDFMGALTACDVLVSADTGPAHIATALGVPRVTIFGPEPPAAWAPANDPSVVTVRAASTLMAQTEPRAVVDAVRRILAADGARARPSR